MRGHIRRTVVAAVVAVAVLAGGTAIAQSSQRFSDVPADHPQADAIHWAADTGLTLGYGDGTFRPGTPLNKRHALIFMERFYDDVLQASEPDGFTRGDMMELLKTINDAGATSPGPVENLDWTSADTAACDALRRTPRYTYPGSPVERLDVGVVSVGFDPPGFFDDLSVPEFRRDELLAAVETQLEALSHGRTDVVFRLLDDVVLSGGPNDYVTGPDYLGNRFQTKIVPEVRKAHPGASNLLIFTTTTAEYRNTGFQSGSSAVVPVEGHRTPPLDPDIRFWWARQAASHELLHVLGLDDLYAITHRDPSTAAGESSLMGMRAYGWGLGTSPRGTHEPVTGWNKWLLGWLDGPNVACVTPTEPTTVVVRPHQHATFPVQLGGEYCWRSDAPRWGPAAPDPVIAIVPTSDTTALVVEADPFSGQGNSSQDRCGPPDHPTSRTSREIGDVIVYAVDVTVRGGDRPQRMVNQLITLVTPAEHEQITRSWSPGGTVGRRVSTDLGWPVLPVDDYYRTEVIAHGYRIAVQDRRTAADGQPEIIVTIEPAS